MVHNHTAIFTLGKALMNYQHCLLTILFYFFHENTEQINKKHGIVKIKLTDYCALVNSVFVIDTSQMPLLYYSDVYLHLFKTSTSRFICIGKCSNWLLII